MAMTIEELQVLITAETRGLRSELNNLRSQIRQTTSHVERETNKINKSFSAIASSIKAATVAALGFIAVKGMTEYAKDSVKSFGEMEASLQNVQRTLGQSATTIMDWANNQAAAFGMAKDQAIVYSNTMSLLVSSFIKDQQAAADATQNLLENAGIIASRTGRTIDDVLMRITSGLRGETEAIEDLGIFVQQSVLEQSNAFKQLANGQSWDQLSEFTKQQIRMYAILEQTMAKYGDTMGSGVSTSIGQLTVQLRNLKTEIGEAFAPVVNAAIPYLLTLIEYLRKATEWVRAFTVALFGVSKTKGVKSENKALNDFNKGLQTGAGGANAVASGLDQSAKNAKKLKSVLAGFDEINKLDFGNGADANKDAPSVAIPDMKPFEMPPIEETEIMKSAKETAEKLRRIFEGIKIVWNNFFTPWQQAFAKYAPQMKADMMRLVSSIGDIFRTIGTTLNSIFKHDGYKQFADGMVGTLTELNGLFVDIFQGTIAPLLIGFFEGFNPDKNPAMDRFMTKLGDVSQSIMACVSAIRDHMQPVFEKMKPLFEELGRLISDVLIGAFNWLMELLKGFYDRMNPDNNPAMARLIEEFGKLIDIISSAVSAIREHLAPVLEKLEPLFKTIGSVIADIVIGAIGWLIELFKGFFETIDPSKNPAMASLIEKIGVVGEKLNNLVQIVGESLIPIFDALKPVFKFVGEIIASFIIETLQSLLGLLEGIIEFLTGVFTGDWEKTWNGLKEIVINVVELVILKKLGTFVKSIGNLFNPLKKFFKDLWTGIKDKFDEIFGFFGGIATKAKNRVLSPFEKIGGWFRERFESARNAVSDKLGVLGGYASKAYNAVTSPFKAIGNWFRKIFDGVTSAVKGSLNFLIDAMNKVISGLNSLKIDIPDWVPKLGGKTFGINIPNIPRLARGGVVDRETMFIAGEAGKEAVMPLEHNTGWISQLASKIASQNPQANQRQPTITNDRPLEVVLQVGQTKLGRVVIKSINQLQKQEGRVLLEL